MILSTNLISNTNKNMPTVNTNNICHRVVFPPRTAKAHFRHNFAKAHKTKHFFFSKGDKMDPTIEMTAKKKEMREFVHKKSETRNKKLVINAYIYFILF